MNQNTSKDAMQLLSPAFNSGQLIPEQFTCKGQNTSPPLNFTNVPAGAKSLAIILHDPDAVGGDFLHWLVWNIPPNTKTIPANSVPSGSIQGKTGFGNNHYGGPCPPAGSGTHHYMFELYALDTTLNLSPLAGRDSIQTAVKDHVLARSMLTGLVTAN